MQEQLGRLAGRAAAEQLQLRLLIQGTPRQGARSALESDGAQARRSRPSAPKQPTHRLHARQPLPCALAQQLDHLLCLRVLLLGEGEAGVRSRQHRAAAPCAQQQLRACECVGGWLWERACFVGACVRGLGGDWAHQRRAGGNEWASTGSAGTGCWLIKLAGQVRSAARSQVVCVREDDFVRASCSNAQP